MPDDKDPHLGSHETGGSGAGGPSSGDPAEPSAVLDPQGTSASEAPEAPAAPTSKPRGDDGFGLWYRFFFRFQYTLLHVIGPPRLTVSMDPRTRMKADYERRKALHQQWKAAQGKR